MTVPALEHYLDIESVSEEQFWGLLRLARDLKVERARMGRNAPILEGKSLAMIFQKPSLRTVRALKWGCNTWVGMRSISARKKWGWGRGRVRRMWRGW